MAKQAQTAPYSLQHQWAILGVHRWGIVLLIFHLVGLVGLNLNSSRDLFLLLTPFNLLLTATLLFWQHEHFNRPFILFATGIFLAGLGIEMIGVQTGIIFGHYTYGEALGPKIMETPWMIGVNWLVLIYATGGIANRLAAPWWVKTMVAASLMVVLDFFIEPVATCLGFWTWQEGIIPIQNYIAWWVVSSAMLVFFYKVRFSKDNPISPWVYGVQLLFFTGNLVLGNC